MAQSLIELIKLLRDRSSAGLMDCKLHCLTAITIRQSLRLVERKVSKSR